jgi:hypothetical protein
MIQTSMNNNITENIFVLLTDTGTLFTRLIKGFTGAPYNHASIVLDENMEEVFSFGRKRANNPLIAGFVKEDVYEGTFRQFPDTRCALLRIAVTGEQRANVIKIVREFEKNEHLYSYNLIGLVGVLLDWDLRTTHSYFCSQFVAETMRQSGIPVCNRPSTLVTPNDFLNHNQFHVVYEGLLYDYPQLNRQQLVHHSRAKITVSQLRKRAI